LPALAFSLGNFDRIFFAASTRSNTFGSTFLDDGYCEGPSLERAERSDEDGPSKTAMIIAKRL